MNIDEKILEILHDFETFKLTDDEQGVYTKTTSYMPFIDRIKALTTPDVVGQSEQYCDCDVKGSFDEETIHRCRKCDKVME